MDTEDDKDVTLRQKIGDLLDRKYQQESKDARLFACKRNNMGWSEGYLKKSTIPIKV